MVLPPGVFMTITPRRVAASTSTLSTPTPARPTTRKRAPACKIGAVTFVWLRTTIALNSGMILHQLRFAQAGVDGHLERSVRA